MADKWLQEIRGKIACPQFGDDHYGAWGSLSIDLRRSVKRMLDYITGQEEYINRQKAEYNNLFAWNKELNKALEIKKAEVETLKEKNRNAMRCSPKAIRRAKAEAIKECLLQLEAEIERCKKYIREYDDREVQKAYCKGLESAYYVIKEMVGDV